jgi:hypothetical protein
MTYDPNIPAPNNFLSADQPRMQVNFSRTNASFGVDHVDIVTPANSSSGEHKQTTFSTIQVDPALPYPKGRIYQKNFGKAAATPAPGFTHELYFAGTRESAAQQITLLPSIKCMCRFVLGPNGLQNVLPGAPPPAASDSLIINMNPGQVGPAGSVNRNNTAFDVTFLQNLSYDSYFVFVFTEGFGSSANITNKMPNSFRIQMGGVGANGTIIGFMVI